MYKVSHFIEKDETAVFNFMQLHNFALVCGIGANYPVATQLPLEISLEDDELSLTGHIMRNTDHHIAFKENPKVLAIFTSPHAVIDAGWYRNPAVASTINYMSVHAQGEISFTDEQGTYEAIKTATNTHIDPGSEGAFEKIPQEYIDNMLKAIVGFKISVTTLQHVFKLSQNRDKTDQDSIVSKLIERGMAGDLFIAGEMQKRK